MTKKTVRKKSTRKAQPDYALTGNVTESDGWEAVWFDYDDDDGADMDSVVRLPVACWATAKLGREVQVCGMVSGPYGLEVAELDEDFRGYIKLTDSGGHEAPLAEFVDVWEAEHEVGEYGPEPEEEEEDDPEDDPD